MSSVIYFLETEEIPRLRMGVGPVPQETEVKDFVLSIFSKEEMIVVKGMIDSAKRAIETIINNGFEASMN